MKNEPVLEELNLENASIEEHKCQECYKVYHSDKSLKRHIYRVHKKKPTKKPVEVNSTERY